MMRSPSRPRDELLDTINTNHAVMEIKLSSVLHHRMKITYGYKTDHPSFVEDVVGIPHQENSQDIFF